MKTFTLGDCDPMTTPKDEETSTLSSMYSNIVEAVTLAITPSRYEVLFDRLLSKIKNPRNIIQTKKFTSTSIVDLVHLAIWMSKTDPCQKPPLQRQP
jgi:hypothetical protein